MSFLQKVSEKRHFYGIYSRRPRDDPVEEAAAEAIKEKILVCMPPDILTYSYFTKSPSSDTELCSLSFLLCYYDISAESLDIDLIKKKKVSFLAHCTRKVSYSVIIISV